MSYSNFKVQELCFFSLLQNSKKISEIRDQNIPIFSEKCYNSGLQHDTCLYYVANERPIFQAFKLMYYHIREHPKNALPLFPLCTSILPHAPQYSSHVPQYFPRVPQYSPHVPQCPPHVPQYSSHVPQCPPHVPLYSPMCPSTPPCAPVLPPCAPVLFHVYPICLRTTLCRLSESVMFLLLFILKKNAQ